MTLRSALIQAIATLFGQVDHQSALIRDQARIAEAVLWIRSDAPELTAMVSAYDVDATIAALVAGQDTATGGFIDYTQPTPKPGIFPSARVASLYLKLGMAAPTESARLLADYAMMDSRVDLSETNINSLSGLMVMLLPHYNLTGGRNYLAKAQFYAQLILARQSNGDFISAGEAFADQYHDVKPSYTGLITLDLMQIEARNVSIRNSVKLALDNQVYRISSNNKILEYPELTNELYPWETVPALFKYQSITGDTANRSQAESLLSTMIDYAGSAPPTATTELLLTLCQCLPFLE